MASSEFRTFTDASEAPPDDEFDSYHQQQQLSSQKHAKLMHSTSVGSQLVPATMVKRKKQSEDGNSRLNFGRSPVSSQGPLLRQFFNRNVSPNNLHEDEFGDNASQLL